MNFHLVQRLWHFPRTFRTGFDSHFECQYMGASEYEWGAVGESLKRIRAQQPVIVHTSDITYRPQGQDPVTRTLYTVGPQRLAREAAILLPEALNQGTYAPMEQCFFPAALTGDLAEYQRSTGAWWSLSDDVAWTLDEEIAQALLDGFNGVQATEPAPTTTSA